MSSTLRDKAKRHGTASIYGGSEPRREELTAHLPKPKIKPLRFKLPKRAAKRKRKAKITKHADALTYQARLAAPWSIYVRAKEGD